tara:strand:+ start:45 stop:503 length:459 start_codon:yes stop_codon:yes gene_type:complete
MAHFAELNSSNEVLRVVVISNDDVAANGGDQHADAETFVASIVPHSTGGTSWKQTSYNNNFRKQYAGLGFTYDATKNKFIGLKPYTSWSLDSNDDWKAPVTYPNVNKISSNHVEITWDEDNQKWLGKTYTGDDLSTITNYQWDASGLSWTEV